MQEHNDQPQHKLQELIQSIRFAMFTTRDAQGVLRSRPMTTQNNDDDDADAGRRLWFFMSRTSEPVLELLADPNVNVSYADPDNDVYVSASGKARLVDDKAAKIRLWSGMNDAWFPKGIDDPDLALVCVDLADAEYWNVTESKITQLFKMAKASFTGEPPTDMGEHDRIRQ